MECAAKIDRDFIRRQAQISMAEKNEIIVSYNVTAMDIRSLASQT